MQTDNQRDHRLYLLGLRVAGEEEVYGLTLDGGVRPLLCEPAGLPIGAAAIRPWPRVDSWAGFDLRVEKAFFKLPSILGDLGDEVVGRREWLPQ